MAYGLVGQMAEPIYLGNIPISHIYTEFSRSFAELHIVDLFTLIGYF